jgi:hypothetical protein
MFSIVQIVIASFQDAYHVRTLQQLLHTCLLLQPGVEVHLIMSLLMDRLTDYASTSDDDIFQDDAAFQCFLSAARGCGIKCASCPCFCSFCGLACSAAQSRVLEARKSWLANFHRLGQLLVDGRANDFSELIVSITTPRNC